MSFTPYWLIHEPGKEHGIGIVDLDSAISSERAIEVWREVNADDHRIMGIDGIEVEATLIRQPFIAY